MPSRRAFIRSGIAVTAVAAGLWRANAVASTHAAAARTGPVPLFKMVFDASFPAGAAFGAAAARRGAPVHAIGGDIGGLWMNTLEPRLREGPVALAGLTAGATLFCLELLARDYGLGPVYRIEHAPQPDGRVRHTFAGDAQLASSTERLAAAGEDWALHAAELATGVARELRPVADVELLDLRGSERAAQSLFTWVLAFAPVGAAFGHDPRKSRD
jgi:hypothetical protein